MDDRNVVTVRIPARHVIVVLATSEGHEVPLRVAFVQADVSLP
jgi:hypothetical protein